MLFTLNTHKDMGPVPTSTQWGLTLIMAERKVPRAGINEEDVSHPIGVDLPYKGGVAGAVPLRRTVRVLTLFSLDDTTTRERRPGLSKLPWGPSTQRRLGERGELPTVRRALRPRGRFLSLTFAQPHFRKPLYARREYRWSVAQHTYGDGFHYFLYAMTAGEELSPEDAAMETRRLEEAEAPPPQVTFMQESDTEDFLGNIAL
ncbi:unnamed protein product [Arctogadus glacialis]